MLTCYSAGWGSNSVPDRAIPSISDFFDAVRSLSLSSLFSVINVSMSCWKCSRVASNSRFFLWSSEVASSIFLCKKIHCLRTNHYQNRDLVSSSARTCNFSIVISFSFVTTDNRFSASSFLIWASLSSSFFAKINCFNSCTQRKRKKWMRLFSFLKY